MAALKMESLVVVTAGELAELVRGAVREVLAESQPAPPSDWLDADAAAALLGTSTRTVSNLVKRGELAHARVGRLLRFRRVDVLALLEAR